MRTSRSLVTITALTAFVLSACSSASVFEIPVGSCASSQSFGSASEGILQELPLIDCADEHDLEAFAAMKLEGDTFPGDESVTQTADQFCIDEFETFVGTAYEESELMVTYFAPTQESWDKSGDREVLCWVMSSTPVTGTLAGAAR